MKTLILGGSGSGKSELAEQICLDYGGKLTYVATMQPFGNGASSRIERHRKLREGKGFHTIECYRDLALQGEIDRGTVLLECLGNLLANELFFDGASSESARLKVCEGIKMLEYASDNLVVVSNDVMSDGGDYDKETQEYIRLLASINVDIAKHFDQVIEVVCGLPLWHKKEDRRDGTDAIIVAERANQESTGKESW